MDLIMKDVAGLLHVSEATIKQWIIEGSIPCYRVADQYRFSLLEIEDWVLAKQWGDSPFNSGDEEVESGGSQQYSLFRAIHKGGVLHQVAGDSKEEVICNATQVIAEDLSLDCEVLSELLIDRENLQPTALGHGIGLPHTRDTFFNAKHDHVVVCFPEKPIEDYGALDGEPVHTLFFLFASSDKKHLHLLAKIAHLANRDETLALLKTKPNKVKLLSYIKEWESQVGKFQPRSKAS